MAVTQARKYGALILIIAGISLFVGWRMTRPTPPRVSDEALAVSLPKWTPPALPDVLQHADQTDPRLSNHIRSQWVVPPFIGPRNLKTPEREHYSQRGQSAYVDKLLGGRTRGFYIECGAANGEALSNSLFFEKSRNWSGLLVEANPYLFSQVLDLRRHAYMMNACLSPKRQPDVLDFRVAGYIGGLTGYMDQSHKNRIVYEEGEAKPIRIQCFPLYSILKALNVTHVDFFSLDIEGAELDIMKTFPFDEIKVDVITIEYMIGGNSVMSQQKLEQMRQLMVGKYGYKETDYRGTEDVMFSKL